MACTELHDTGQNHYHLEKQGLGYPWLLKRFSIFFWPTDSTHRHEGIAFKCQMLIDITLLPHETHIQMRKKTIVT